MRGAVGKFLMVLLWQVSTWRICSCQHASGFDIRLKSDSLTDFNGVMTRWQISSSIKSKCHQLLTGGSVKRAKVRVNYGELRVAAKECLPRWWRVVGWEAALLCRESHECKHDIHRAHCWLRVRDAFGACPRVCVKENWGIFNQGLYTYIDLVFKCKWEVHIIKRSLGSRARHMRRWRRCVWGEGGREETASARTGEITIKSKVHGRSTGTGVGKH